MGNLSMALKRKTDEVRNKTLYSPSVKEEMDTIDTLRLVLDAMDAASKNGRGYVRFEAHGQTQRKKFNRAAEYFRNLGIDIKIDTLPDYMVFNFTWEEGPF